jgi:hypothetical protein
MRARSACVYASFWGSYSYQYKSLIERCIFALLPILMHLCSIYRFPLLLDGVVGIYFLREVAIFRVWI